MNKIIALCLFLISGTVAYGQSEYFDLAYLPAEEINEDTLQRLNLFLPENDDAPLLLWIGGGA